MREIFEDLKGWEDYYQISENGRIFSKRRMVGNRIIFGREMKPRVTVDGYLKVGLSRDSGTRNMYIHRLVASQFIPNPDNLPQVNHKDGDKLNNHYSNLEWCTKAANGQHAKEHGLMQHGEDRPSSKLTEKEVLEIYKLQGYVRARDVAERFGVATNTIHLIWRGTKWRYLYDRYHNGETI